MVCAHSIMVASKKFCAKRNSQLDIFGLRIFLFFLSKWNWIFSTRNSKIIKQMKEKKYWAQNADLSDLLAFCMISSEVNIQQLFRMCILTHIKLKWILCWIWPYFRGFYEFQGLFSFFLFLKKRHNNAKDEKKTTTTMMKKKNYER